jgi:LuxR family maltose regulon positive regulatory protein
MEFLTRTAVLERMSRPLCDQVLDTTGSAERLASFRVEPVADPLDQQPQWRWYRYHQLFQELLQAELKRREPS